MTINWQSLYSERVAGLYGSMTRQLMHVMSKPDIISFGGGLPAWDLFPVEQVREVVDTLLRLDGSAVLQYGSSEGYGPLRQQIASRYQSRGFQVTADNILIDTGSMQGIDLVGKLLLNKGDAVVVGDPTFLTALQAFSFYQARYLPVPLDEEGMQVDLLPPILEQNRVKFIYIMPTFQNPTGCTLSLARRQQLVETAAHYGVPIVEDDSYGELRYSGEPLPALKVLDDGDGVIYLGSFSKILSPGLRVGFVAAPAAFMNKLILVKQTADLHTSILPQRIVHEFLRQGLLEPHIQYLITHYRQRQGAMVDALTSFFPTGVHWTRPQGGIFLWVTVDGMDTAVLFEQAAADGVVFVPGCHYYAHGGGENTMRLNFSAYGKDKIREGVRRLAAAVQTRAQPIA